MVDKSSLRSNRGSKDSKDNKKPDQKQPAKSSSRKLPAKKSASGSSEMEDKQLDSEDVDMKDDSAPQKPIAIKKVGAGGDVEMEDGKASGNDGDDKKDEAKEDPIIVAINEIKDNFTLLERAVTLFDARFTLRVLRTISSLRRRLTPEILAKVIKETYPAEHPSVRRLEAVIKYDGAMEVESTEVTSKEGASGNVLPEVDIYIHLLAQIYLLDQKSLEEGAKFSTELVETIHLLNRRTLDSLAAKVYFYYARFHELLPSPTITSIRPQLLASLRTATLRKDIDTQATLITLLLRNYLLTSHITQADHLVSKTVFPESAANNLIARYQYYLGRIRAIQLDYTAAHNELVGAIRKAPQTAAAAGFVQAANKLNIIVELLMGVKSFTIENTGSIPKLFSMRLGTYFNAWDTQARIMLKDPSKQKQWNRSVVDALVEAHSWVARLSRFQRQTEDCRVTGGLQARYPEFGDQVCGTLPAIIRLAEAIDCGRRRIFRSCHADVSPALTWKCPDGAAGARRHRLQSRHWCPFTISMLEATTCQSVMDWIDSTQKEYPSPHHASCTESACSRNNLNTSAYKTEHVNPQCVCAFIAPSLDDMIPIFQQDGTPVIRVVHNGVETRLEVSASSPRNPYVAFSHVWVDGLGSVSEKGIPTCQALRLSALAEEALGPGAALWIDSLCIPETYVWRKRATTALNRTYREATAVVVVDQTIRKSQRGIDAEDFLLAIYTSAWCQRLWTYLESILAQSIFFEVSEGLMRFPISSTRALAWRSTTKCDAETIALGTVLGIDVRRLLKVNAEVRKMMFFKLVKRLPYNIIFLSGPKLSLRPFRWAPFTLMSQVGIRLDADDGSQTSLCTANGLVGNYLVLRLSRSMTKCPVTRKWYAFDSSSDATYILTAPSYGWSSEPDSCPFDHIAIDSEFKEVPSFNRVTSAVALMGKRKCSIPDVTVCNYVGPMFLECVRGNIRSIGAVLCNTQALDLCIQ